MTVSAAGELEGGDRECERIRCTAVVVDALAIGVSGHRKVVLDPVPTTYAEGARYVASANQWNPGEFLVKQVTQPRQAFGVRWLYADHKRTCAGGTGVKARSREADG